MKKLFLLFILISSYAFSQSINNYEYVIVPEKFSDFSEKNKFNLNTNVKLLLQKYGFKAYLVNEALPFEIANANCNKLHADLVKDNSLMSTKVKIVLLDCQGKVVYETAYGKSNEKEYAIAYNLALRAAAQSFDNLHYKYNGKSDIGNVPETKAVIPEKQESAKFANISTEPLSAKPFGANGYQLMTNNTDVPRYVMTIYKTSSPDCYLVNNGVLLRKAGNWFLEYYKEDKLVSEAITIVNLNQ